MVINGLGAIEHGEQANVDGVRAQDVNRDGRVSALDAPAHCELAEVCQRTR